MIKRRRPDFKSALGQPIRTCDLEDIRIRLEAPFHPNEVDWRVGASSGQNQHGQWTNQAWAYIDARDVQRRFDRVVGFGLWDSTTRVEGKFIICDIKLKFEWDWVNRSDGTHIGDVEIDTSKKGSQNRTENREFEKEKDNTVMETKGSYSIAFKRAAVKWGIGAYLYDLPKPVRHTDPKTRQFGPWSLIEFWMIAAHAYAEYREEIGTEWGREEKGEDFAEWTRRKGIDMSEVCDGQGRAIFDSQEKLTAWCEGRGMDPEKVPFTRKRATKQEAAPMTDSTPAPAKTAPAQPPTPPTPTPPATTPTSAPTHTTTPAPTQTAPSSATPQTSSQPSDSKLDKAAQAQIHVKKTIADAKSKDDLVKVIVQVAVLNKQGTLTVMEASALLDLVYSRLVETVNTEKTVTAEEAKTVYNTYCTERKTIDVAWQPPPRNKAK
jgi:hypothetical protein